MIPRDVPGNTEEEKEEDEQKRDIAWNAEGEEGTRSTA